jgi:hypothetical protein
MSGADKYFDQGDLIVSEGLRKLFPFCVECKHRKNFRLEHVFMGVKDFFDYHRQVLDACNREGNTRTPMVVIRGQGGLIFAAVPSLTVVSMKYKLPDTAAVVSYRTTHLRWFMTDLDSMLQVIFTKEAATDGLSNTRLRGLNTETCRQHGRKTTITHGARSKRSRS